ncbi:hypothetical protein NDU88_006304 [Pleurodeles waltl]|uniref:Uncharacterized protein n=1 Tax=Pleurodeles waltl TaxID=8319 RepID=A0AAV7RRP5_PLEWA|nr:hypothetical protein NDU88_006304 [Pleurodeles waltl]
MGESLTMQSWKVTWKKSDCKSSVAGINSSESQAEPDKRALSKSRYQRKNVQRDVYIRSPQSPCRAPTTATVSLVNNCNDDSNMNNYLTICKQKCI